MAAAMKPRSAKMPPDMKINVHTRRGQVELTMLVAVKVISPELMKIAKTEVISRMACQVPMSSAERGSARRMSWQSFHASTRISVRG